MELQAYIKQVQERVNGCMQEKLERLPASPSDLKEAMCYALLLGGKRARPFLVYATGQAFGAPLHQLDAVAAAVECIHAYSLIHDDMPEMDNDMLRRGMPTVHAKFGPALALLAGDTLQTLAFDFLAHAPNLSPDVKVHLFATLTQAAGFSGMCGGQALDLAAEKMHLEQGPLEELHARKTGALIEAAVVMGYIAARYEDTYQSDQADVIGRSLAFAEKPQLARELNLLKTYAKRVGLAFQVWDDVLDVDGDSAVMGKSVGSDQSHEKSTYVSLMGLNEAKAYAQQLCQEAIEPLSLMSEDTSLLEQFARFSVQRDH